MATERGRVRAAARWAGGALALVCLASAAVLVWLALRPAPGGLEDLDGRSVVLDEPPDVVAADPVPTGGRFQAPAQGLDVPLVEMNVVNGAINPPTLTEAFLVRDYGSPREPGSGLVVVAMHAVRGGRAPGNAFFDMGATVSAVTVQVGDTVVVDGVDHVVTASAVLGKAAASVSNEIWGDPEGRDGELVIVTCLQRARETGAAQDNLVIWAERVDKTDRALDQ